MSQPNPTPAAPIAKLPDALVHLAERLREAMGQLQENKAQLEAEAAAQLRHTEDKLHEVTSATESAATSIMDGVNVATDLVMQLEALALPGEAAPIIARLHDELFNLTMHLQFQDITTQQINYATSVIRATEGQLLTLASHFDPDNLGTDVADVMVDRAGREVAFDPSATTERSDEKQAMADALFGKVA